MGIFQKRYLLLINSILILTSVICLFIIPMAKLVLAVLSVMTFMAVCIFYICKRRNRLICLVCMLSSVAVFLSSSISYMFFDVYCQNQKKYAGSEIVVKATVLSEQYSTESLSGYTVKVTAIANSHENVSFKARLDCMYVSELSVGDVIYARVQASLIDDDINGYNMRRDMLSEGICLTLTSYEESDYIYDQKGAGSISSFFKSLNYDASYKLIDLIGSEEGKLSSALLLGNKNALSDETVRDFSRAGVSHILALSGLHMSILMGGIALLLKKVRVKRVPRAIFLIVFSFFYLALTGFSVSATRSVLMLLCVYLSMLLCYTPDTLTSLSIAGAAIILFSPGAVVDMSFWMSFAATFGIVVFMPLFDRGFEQVFKKWKKLFGLKNVLKSIVGLIFAGTFALIGLSVVLCIFTKEYSKYSLLSSVVLTLPTAFAILISAILPIFAHIPYIGSALVIAVKGSLSFMLDLCAKISVVQNTVFIFNYDFLDYFTVLICMAVFISVAISLKRKWIAPIIPMCAIALLIANVCVYEVNHANDLNIIYTNVSSRGDVIVATKGDEAIICDVSEGSYNALNAAANKVRLANCSEIRALMLTELNSYHISSTSKLFKSQRVRELWIPYPNSEDEYYIMKTLIKSAEQNDVSVKIYENQSKLLAFGNVDIFIDAQIIERSAVPTILVDFSKDGNHIVYTSAAFCEREDIYEISGYIENANALIVGARGPRVKEKYNFFGNSKIEEIVICDIDRAVYLDTQSISKNTPIYVGKKTKNIILN